MDNFGYIQFFTAIHGPFGESEEENVKKKPNSSVHRQDFSLTWIGIILDERLHTHACDFCLHIFGFNLAQS